MAVRAAGAQGKKGAGMKINVSQGSRDLELRLFNQLLVKPRNIEVSQGFSGVRLRLTEKMCVKPQKMP